MQKFKPGDHIFNKETKESYIIQAVTDETYIFNERPGHILTKFIDDDFGLIRGHADRFNSGKLELTQCPVTLRAATAAVFQSNSAKYGGKYADGNWRKGMSWTTVLNSIYRHMAEFECGIDKDAEDGLDPLWHAAANLAMLIEYRTTFKDGDDRLKGKHTSYRKIEEELNVECT